MDRKLILLATLSGMLFCGCAAKEPSQFPVSGTVTLKGQPLDQGTIQFDPTAPEQGTFSGVGIQAGKYSIPAENGLAPGTYRVRISSAEPGPVVEQAAPGESGPPAKDRIPTKYNVETTLQAEVTKDKPN